MRILLIILFFTANVQAQDKPISLLPSATLPLTGTELMPLVQNGVTKKTYVNSVRTDTVYLSDRINAKVDSVKLVGDSVFYYNENGTKHFSFTNVASQDISFNGVDSLWSNGVDTVFWSKDDVTYYTLIDTATVVQSWSLVGNFTQLNSFLGTINDNDLVFKSHNVVGGRIGLYNGNSALGYGTLASSVNNSNEQNTAIGYLALTSTSTGIDNTAVGWSALKFATDAFANTAIGHSSLLIVTTGDENTSVGFSSLSGVYSGSGNVAVGYASGMNANFSNRLFIDNANRTDSVGALHKSLITGVFGADSSVQSVTINGTITATNGYIGAPNISSGTTSPASTPNQVGDIYVDTTGKKIYVATGTSSSGDWTVLN
jgi:hypothetical protein